MKRYILNITLLLAALLTTSLAWGQQITWQELNTQLTGTQTLTGYWKLTGNTTISNGTIKSVGDLHLDLNGHTLKKEGGGFVLSPASGTTMAIYDNSSSKNGKITGGKGDRGGCALISGTLIINGGTITDCETYDDNYEKAESDDMHTTTQGCGGAFFVNQGAKLIMNGGAITNCKTQIQGTSQTGTYNDNTTVDVWGLGGAVFVDSEGNDPGQFTMNGGTISNCSASYGGAVYVHKSLKETDGVRAQGIFMMTNGTITNCNAVKHGGAIYSNGTISMSGGTISSCTTKTHGGAVYIDSEGNNPAKFIMDKGNITNCSASLGGAVYVHMSLNDSTDSQFTMNGGAINKCSSTSHGGAIYIYGGKFKMTSGEISSCTTDIESGWQYPTGEDLPGYGGASGHGGAVYISSVYASSGDSNVLEKEGVFEMTGGSLMRNIAASGGAVMIWTDSKFTMSGSATLGGNIAAGYESGNGLGNGGAVYVQGGKFIIQGGTISNNRAVRYGGAVNLNQSGTLDITGACTISGNIANHGGGLTQEAGLCKMKLDKSGIQVINNIAKINGGGLFIEKGELTIKDATITGNKAGELGGGAALYVQRIEGDLVANISGNTVIQNNTAGTNGGGIALYANPLNTNDSKENLDISEQPDNNSELNSVFVKFDNGKLDTNNAKNGGGIYIYVNEAGNTRSRCVATMDIGTPATAPIISGNNATENGGALSMSSGTFNFNNGEVSTNNAKNGAGIYLGNGKFTIANGTFNQNVASNNGGAIYMGDGRFNGTGNISLTSNSATSSDGGAIYVAKGGFSIKDGTFTSNTAGSDGGAIYMGDGAFSATGNLSLSSNKATSSDGGAIYVAKGGFSIKDGTFTSNTAGSDGGGVYLGAGSFTVSGTTSIAKNVASSGNGGGVLCNGTFTVTSTGKLTIGGDAEADANTANSGNGGGVYCAGSFTVASGGDVKINHNTAQNGGGFCINNGAVTLPQGTVAYNSATQYGGGLYLTNKEATAKTATFAGAGTFDSNTAKAGGGIYADGPINLNLSANVKNNTAENGGGIYISGGVQMKFGNGLIVGNKAETTAAKPETAYQKNAGDVSGVGGGIFMGSGQSDSRKTELRFREVIDPADALKDVFPDNMGIYNNVATWAAADIFANGANTLIELPDISGLNLKDFDVPGNQLYWVEDYVTSDTAYGSGTKVGSGGFRYEDALKHTALAINRLMYNSDTNNVTLGGKTWKMKDISAYACLDLGYDYVFLHLIKKGLDNGDDATFVFSSKRDHDDDPATDDIWVPYTQVLFIGNGATDVERIIGLPSGDWKIEESNWSYKYEALNQTSFTPVQPTETNEFVFKVTRDGIGAKDASGSDLKKDTDGNVKLVVTNTPKTQIDDGDGDMVNIKNINEYNHRKVNILKPTTGN